MLETRIYLTNQLGSLLKDYRKSQNISQKELAERTQIFSLGFRFWKTIRKISVSDS